jgi:hypothetical protein
LRAIILMYIELFYSIPYSLILRYSVRSEIPNSCAASLRFA